MAYQVSKSDRGGETVQQRKTRLQEEGAWKRFVMEREALVESGKTKREAETFLVARFGKNCTALDRKDYLVIDGIEIRARGDYQFGQKMKKEVKGETPKEIPNDEKDTRAVMDLPKIPKDYVPPKASEKYKDRLPNGCPLFHPDDFTKDETRFYEDVMWTEKNLARCDIDETNLAERGCPSISCAKYFWSARYTLEGYESHRKTLADFTKADKSALSRESARADDGDSLDLLKDFLGAVESEWGDDEDGEDDEE